MYMYMQPFVGESPCMLAYIYSAYYMCYVQTSNLHKAATSAMLPEVLVNYTVYCLVVSWRSVSIRLR